MKKDIERKYGECEACLIHSRSKPNIPNSCCEVVPSSLELSAAGEKLAADFGEYGRNKLLIIKDRYSGLLRVYTLPDMTMQSAARGYLKWAHSYGIAKEIRTDGGPGFGSEFTESCRAIGTHHIKSSAYNPSSNGAAERGVGQIKGLLERIGRKNVLTQDELNKLVFKLNSNINLGGSALQRFFARDVATYQPALMRRKLDLAALN